MKWPWQSDNIDILVKLAERIVALESICANLANQVEELRHQKNPQAAKPEIVPDRDSQWLDRRRKIERELAAKQGDV